VIMSSVLPYPWGVEMSGVGCVGLSMMILGKGGILLTKEIVLIMLEIEIGMGMYFLYAWICLVR